MIIQIYAIVTKEDVKALCKIDIDHIGIVVNQMGNKEKGIISIDKAGEIIKIVKECGKISTVILDTTNPEEIEFYTDTLHMDILHVCKTLKENKLRILSELLSEKGTQLMYAIPVKDESSIEEAKMAENYVDIIMLDSPFQSKQMNGFIGASGRTHNWDISAEIVESTFKPVILGGGLSPENVQDAIKKVHPAGVDAKTSLDVPGSFGKKNIEKVVNFVRRVRELEQK